MLTTSLKEENKDNTSPPFPPKEMTYITLYAGWKSESEGNGVKVREVREGEGGVHSARVTLTLASAT